LNLFFNYPE